MEHRICKYCEAIKPIDEFYRLGKTITGNYCNECHECPPKTPILDELNKHYHDDGWSNLAQKIIEFLKLKGIKPEEFYNYIKEDKDEA